MESSYLLTGIGLRTPHYAAFIENRPRLAWLEVHSENYFGEGGRSLHILEKLREDYPISLHGVSLSLGSADELNWQHLNKLRELTERMDPCLVSDHLCWSSIDGRYLHDLLPLPFTEEAMLHVIERIQQIQDYLKRQILIENIAGYLQFQCATMSEPDFLKSIAQQSGCGILLDVNNIYVSSMNLDFDPYQYINSIPSNLVQEIHLAGFATMVVNEKEILIDSHNRPIIPAVWDLYRHTIQTLGLKPTIIEWDTDLPPLDTLCLEAYRAEKIIREIYAAAKHTA